MRLWLPRFVIGRGGSALRPFERVAGGQVCALRAGEVRQMRLLPVIMGKFFWVRHRIGGVMQPAVPFRRYFARFGESFINDPALMSPSFGYAALDKIAVAESIRTNAFAVEETIKPCGDGHGQVM